MSQIQRKEMFFSGDEKYWSERDIKIGMEYVESHTGQKLHIVPVISMAGKEFKIYDNCIEIDGVEHFFNFELILKPQFKMYKTLESVRKPLPWYRHLWIKFKYIFW